MTEPSVDGEPLSDPGAHSESEGAEPVALGPRDFVVAQEDGTADFLYRVGRFSLPELGLLTAVIAVADIDGKLLVALPEGVWNRSVAKRLLPQRAISIGSRLSVRQAGSFGL